MLLVRDCTLRTSDVQTKFSDKLNVGKEVNDKRSAKDIVQVSSTNVCRKRENFLNFEALEKNLICCWAEQ